MKKTLKRIFWIFILILLSGCVYVYIKLYCTYTPKVVKDVNKIINTAISSDFSKEFYDSTFKIKADLGEYDSIYYFDALLSLGEMKYSCPKCYNSYKANYSKFKFYIQNNIPFIWELQDKYHTVICFKNGEIDFKVSRGKYKNNNYRFSRRWNHYFSVIYNNDTSIIYVRNYDYTVKDDNSLDSIPTSKLWIGIN